MTVGTLFHGTRVELAKWFQAIRLIIKSSNQPSVRQLAIEIGVNKNTAASMLRRIRNASIDELDLLNQLLEELDREEH